MRITLVACLLVVARAQPSFLTCSQLCNFDIDPSKWGKNCDCLDETATGVRLPHIDQLENKGIYYEPTDLYLRHLSFLNPPFYIINPTVKLKIEATDPKLNIRKPKTQNVKDDHLQTLVTSLRKKNIVNNNEASVKTTSFDVSSKEVAGLKRLTKEEISDCIELHYASSHYDATTSKLKNYDSVKIEQKCNDLVGILKQKPQDIKNERPKSKELFKEDHSSEQGLFTILPERADSPEILDKQYVSGKDDSKEPEKLKQNLKGSYKNIVFLSAKKISMGEEQAKNVYNQDVTIASTGHILREKQLTDKDNSTVNKQDSLYSTFKTNHISAITNTKVDSLKVSEKHQQVDAHDLLNSEEILDLQNSTVASFGVFKNNSMHLLNKTEETDKSTKQISGESVKFDENHLNGNVISSNSKNNEIMYSSSGVHITTQHDMFYLNKLISTQSAISSKSSNAKDDYIDKYFNKLKLFDDVNIAYTSTTSIIRDSEHVNKDISLHLPVLRNGNNIKHNDSYLMNNWESINTKDKHRTLRGKVEKDLSAVSDSRNNLSLKFQNNYTNSDTITLSKIITREFENGTVVSSVYGPHISKSPDTSPQDSAPRHNVTTALNFMKLIQSETKEEEFLSGKMYFIFNKLHIPSRFIQNDNGDISVGIDGLALCNKLSFAVKSLINRICSEIVSNKQQ